MKLVFIYYWSVEYVADGEHTFPFDHASKDEFLFEGLELIKQFKEICENLEYYRNGNITFLNMEFNVGCLEDSLHEQNVFTLEEWFDKYSLR